jgi:cell division protein FtsW
VIILLLIGIAVLASVSASFSQEKFNISTHFLFHQIFYGLLPGLILGYIAFKIDIGLIKKHAFSIVLISFVLMVLVFFPIIGVKSGGASRWINLGFTTFQPSELLKISFIIYLSAWLVNATKKNKFFKKEEAENLIDKIKNQFLEIFPFLIVLGVVILLLAFQSDLSTLVLILGVAILLYFVANTPLWHTVSMIIFCSGLGLLLIKIAPYRMRRILVLFDPNTDPMGMGYQIKQILIAIGSGGIFGLGPGMSSQKFGFIPQTMADSIFAIFGEEFGFIGSFILVILFLFILWRGIKIAKQSEDIFSKLLALGISSWICMQAFINIAAMIRLFPLTGIPLPLISYGGSHIIVELISIGLLLNISKK